jgi:hypothetical protein
MRLLVSLRMRTIRLFKALLAYNTTIQIRTGFTPFELILSRVPSSGILHPDIAFGGDPPLSSKAVFRQNF